MSKSFSLMVFAAVCATVYLLGFINGWTTFRYYPLLGQFTTQDLPRNAGPAMSWFAWIAQGAAAGVVAAVAALVLPRAVTDRIGLGLVWAVPAVLIVYTFFYEWHWFQGR